MTLNERIETREKELATAMQQARELNEQAQNLNSLSARVSAKIVELTGQIRDLKEVASELATSEVVCPKS